MSKPIVTTTHVFFYGGYPSQFYPCMFTGVIYGKTITFNCAEQWMHANKAALFKDRDAYMRIMRAVRPKDQQAAGRDVKPYDEAKWAAVRYDIVVDGNICKFGQNRDMREWLLTAGKDRHFVEASPYDRLWGIGLSVFDAQTRPESEWPGRNLLGKALDETVLWLTAGVRGRFRDDALASAER